MSWDSKGKPRRTKEMPSRSARILYWLLLFVFCSIRALWKLKWGRGKVRPKGQIVWTRSLNYTFPTPLPGWWRWGSSNLNTTGVATLERNSQAKWSKLTGLNLLGKGRLEKWIVRASILERRTASAEFELCASGQRPKILFRFPIRYRI